MPYGPRMAVKQGDDLREALRARGMRVTPARLAVLALLRASDQPLSHAEVGDYLAAHAWDQATLYRNLIELAEVGLVRRTDVGDHVWRFEATQGNHDAATHPHFTCTVCGSVECLPPVELVATRGKLPRALRQRQIEVHVRGVCDQCS